MSLANPVRGNGVGGRTAQVQVQVQGRGCEWVWASVLALRGWVRKQVHIYGQPVNPDNRIKHRTARSKTPGVKHKSVLAAKRYHAILLKHKQGGCDMARSDTQIYDMTRHGAF